MIKRLKKSEGFTLIEIAVVIVIIGIIITAVSSILPSIVSSSRSRKAAAELKKIDFALQGFCLMNSRLPYADSGTDGTENAGTYVGNIPFVTLGITTGKDGWDKDIKYAVFEDITDTTSSNFCTTLSGVTTYSNAAKIHTKNKETDAISNMAYILISGGESDLDADGTDGYFDGLNEGSDVVFDDPTRTEFHGGSASYNDIMRSFSLTSLIQRKCVGSGST